MAYSTRPKMWFWIVTILFLLWNLMGVGAYIFEMSGDMESMAAYYTKEQIDFFTSFPDWYTWSYGIAVFAGLFASVALLFKKRQAVLLALLSLIAVIVCRVYDLTVDAWSIMDVVDRFFLILVPVLSILLWLFARSVRVKGWLK